MTREQTPWDQDQDFRDVPAIERTYLVRLPCGELAEVNRFDMNLELCTKSERYIQLADGAWIKPNRLAFLSADEQRAYLGSNSRNATADELLTEVETPS